MQVKNNLSVSLKLFVIYKYSAVWVTTQSFGSLSYIWKHRGAICFVGLVCLIRDIIGITILLSSIFISEILMLWMFWALWPHFTLIVNFFNLIKIQALHTLLLSFKFWIIAICLWGIQIKKPPHLTLSFYLFPESLLSPCCFLPVLDATVTGHWSSLTGDMDNSLTVDSHCSLTEKMLALTGDVGLFTGDVNVLCLLWDWWELHLSFLLFIVRKCT